MGQQLLTPYARSSYLPVVQKFFVPPYFKLRPRKSFITAISTCLDRTLLRTDRNYPPSLFLLLVNSLLKLRKFLLFSFKLETKLEDSFEL
jgi:hypothetical protein